MPNPKLVAVTFVLLVLLAGCSTTPPAPAVDVAAEQAKIRDIEASWVKEAAAKDVDKIAAHYADDAVFMGPGAPAAKTKDAIRAEWKGMLDAAEKLNFLSDRITISQAGDMAVSRGSYTMMLADPKTKKPVEDKGSYVTVYKKQADGGWQAIEDIAVSETAH